MRRLGMALALVLGATSVVYAQQAQQNVQATTQANNPNSSVVQPGLAKPPAGMPSSGPSRSQPGVPPSLPNNPTVSGFAKQSGPTVGSPVPVHGAGGTTIVRNQAGQKSSPSSFWTYLLNKL